MYIRKIPILGIMAVTISIMYICLEFSQNEYFANLISLFILAFCLYSFTLLSKNIKLILSLFFILSIGICFTLDNPVDVFLKGIRSNLPLISLFILSSMLSIIVRNANYIQALKIFLKKFRNNPYFYYINTFILTHLFGVILNISTVQINLYLSKAYNISSIKLITRILNRGFTTTLYWSPYFSATALVLSNLSVVWSEIALLSLGFVIITIMISFTLDLPVLNQEYSRLKQSDEEPPNVDLILDKKQNNYLVQLISSIVILCLLTIIIEKYILHNMVLTICILSILYPILWSFLTKDIVRFKSELNSYLYHSLPNFKQEVTLFTTAGLVSTLFAASPLRFYLVNALVYLADYSVFLISWIICLSIILSAIIGLHPIFLVTLLVTSVDPTTLGIEPVFFASLLLVSWGISNNVSPITAVNGILSRAFNLPLNQVSFQWNWQLSFILIILLPIYLFTFI